MNLVGFFDQKRSIELGLDAEDLVLLRWFIYFSNSGKQESIINEGKIYYWVVYEKTFVDNPILGSSFNVGKRFRKMSEKNGPLESYRTIKDKKPRVYYRCKENVVKYLEGDKMIGKLIVYDGEPKIKLKYHTIEILQSISHLHIKGQLKPLFTFIYSEDSDIPSYMLNFEKTLGKIYRGSFHRDCILSDKFLEVNKHNLIEDSFDMLKEAKGDWARIGKLIYKSAKHFTFWFMPEYMPLSKNWLSKYRNLNSWLYDDYMKDSMFLACLMKKPDSSESGVAEKIKSKLPIVYQKEAQKFKDEMFPGLSSHEENTYWFAISSVYKAEIKLKEMFGSEYMMSVWLKGNGDWSTKYLNWLKTCWGENTKGMLRFFHVGVKGKTWKEWLSSDPDLEVKADDLFNFTS